MRTRLYFLSLSAFTLFLCGFFTYDYYQHYKLKNNEKIVTGQVTESRVTSQKGINTYTIRYRYRVDDKDYTGSDDVPKDFYRRYGALRGPINICYEASNPSNSELSHLALPENHNDINLPHGIFMLATAFGGIYFLRQGSKGVFTKIQIPIMYFCSRVTKRACTLTCSRSKSEFRDLRELKKLLDDGSITEAEFVAKKQDILKRI